MENHGCQDLPGADSSMFICPFFLPQIKGLHKGCEVLNQDLFLTALPDSFFVSGNAGYFEHVLQV
jgi:hypothetical protein